MIFRIWLIVGLQRVTVICTLNSLKYLDFLGRACSWPVQSSTSLDWKNWFSQILCTWQLFKSTLKNIYISVDLQYESLSVMGSCPVRYSSFLLPHPLSPLFITQFPSWPPRIMSCCDTRKEPNFWIFPLLGTFKNRI